MTEAAALADSYEKALVKGQWQTAWAILSSADQVLRGSLAAYTYERAAFFKSVAGLYELSAPTHDAATLATWASSPDLTSGADPARAFVVQATYPALAGNNAGFEIFLVAPDPSGSWRLWVLR